ncbi:MAG: precorrin-6y C5,15-methyltransferase (decarboxylating) subunit CbiE [Methylovirgula sp.]|uniref:precorrin-6y C5,15-methyltransferase (decarboxylating) subunit CbiE n=1 Tax=Methylovirgula sp. TaxID=1978224 RepID=UPI0030766026
MDSSSPTRWLRIIGIGEDGLDGLSPAARRLLSQAEFIIGGARHLALLGETKAKTLVWPTPFERGIDEIVARRGTPVCVLASGDPFYYGVGATLAGHISPDEMICLPALSSLCLAAARLGWPLQDCDVISLHGRAFERIIPHLRPNARLLALSWDASTPEKLARLLVARGLGGSRLVVLEALGGPKEHIRESTADAFKPREIAALNLIAVEINAAHGAAFIPLTPGLPDEWFESDGQLTKREIRAVTLSALAPWPGARLWDIGAGSGSIGIEWMLAHPRNRAVAIEVREDRATRIARNAAALGVPDLEILTGDALTLMQNLRSPDAIFVGGGGGAMIDAAWTYLASGRRFVANGVTIETQSRLAELHTQNGGELVSLSVAHPQIVGGYRSWRPAMPVVQWAVTKS